MASYVNEAYGAPERFSGFGLLLATYAFAVQIYCDFSGYSDIAIGAARMLGIGLPENFRSPYLSLSISEFWRHWHISLSSWLRDYLYIPLGGNRRGTARTYVNLMITMLLGGLWHGAGWNWVLWGGLQGAIMSIERAAGIATTESTKRNAASILRWVVTFHLVCLSWVFFRAQGVQQAFEVLGRIVTLTPGDIAWSPRPLLYLGVLLVVELGSVRDQWLSFATAHPVMIRWAAYFATAALILTFAGTDNREFIYFQF